MTEQAIEAMHDKSGMETEALIKAVLDLSSNVRVSGSSLAVLIAELHKRHRGTAKEFEIFGRETLNLERGNLYLYRRAGQAAFTFYQTRYSKTLDHFTGQVQNSEPAKLPPVNVLEILPATIKRLPEGEDPKTLLKDVLAGKLGVTELRALHKAPPKQSLEDQINETNPYAADFDTQLAIGLLAVQSVRELLQAQVSPLSAKQAQIIMELAQAIIETVENAVAEADRVSDVIDSVLVDEPAKTEIHQPQQGTAF